MKNLSIFIHLVGLSALLALWIRATSNQLETAYIIAILWCLSSLLNATMKKE